MYPLSDFMVNEIVKNPDSYKRSVRIRARELYDKRGLSSEEKQRQILEYGALRDKVQFISKDGGSVNEQMEFLIHSGMSKNQAKYFLDQLNSNEETILGDEKGGSSKVGIFITVLTVAIIIKWIVRLVMSFM